jgi:hypothetical protein
MKKPEVENLVVLSLLRSVDSDFSSLIKPFLGPQPRISQGFIFYAPERPLMHLTVAVDF